MNERAQPCQAEKRDWEEGEKQIIDHEDAGS
jgi:hypothetical protein